MRERVSPRRSLLPLTRTILCSLVVFVSRGSLSIIRDLYPDMCFHSAVTAAGPRSFSPGLVVCLEIDLAAALTGRVPSSFVCCVPVLLQVCISVALARLELDVWDCATREGSLAAQPAAQPTDEGRLV